MLTAATEGRRRMSYQFLKTYDAGGAAWISINRPP